MDLGCGNGRLKKYISSDMTYFGVDYVQRDENTIVCDLNQEPLPEMDVDVYYMAGLLCYIDDIERLFAQMRRGKYIIFSYSEELLYLRLDGVYKNIWTPILNKRDGYLTISMIINALRRSGFVVDEVVCDYEKRYIYYFRAVRADLD